MTKMLNGLLLNTNGRTNDHVIQQSKNEWRMKVLDHLLKIVCDAAVFNPEVQVVLACILWPDGDRQWEAVPWHHMFKGDHIYDLHLTLIEKREAREAVE